MLDTEELRQREGIAALIGQLAPNEGYGPSVLEGVMLGRVSSYTPRTPVMYEPGICFVLQGRKRCFLGDQPFDYDPYHYLVLSAPLSLDCETVASPAEPVLGLFLRLDLSMVAELLLALDEAQGASMVKPTGIFASRLTAEMTDAVHRLLLALRSPADARILGPGILREICYRVLTGEQGDELRAALAQRGEFGQISKALRRIHEDCAAPMDVAQLAREAHMSPASFHTKFKALTSTSPMQYLKAIRLHRARLLMLQEGLSAGTAATRVGYESVSQFSREFKRMFNRTPSEEIAQMRSLYARPVEEPAPRARFLSTV